MSETTLPASLAVFVVEDEALVALNLEAMLEDIGCRVVGPAMRFGQAEQMIAEGVPADVAILDVNIGGRQVFELAHDLLRRGIPIVFATGYGREGLPGEWLSQPILQKPYVEREVREALHEAISARRT